MKPTLQKDLADIAQEIIRATEEQFTGQMTITLNMRKGGIGQIGLKMEKNLKNEIFSQSRCTNDKN